MSLREMMDHDHVVEVGHGGAVRVLPYGESPCVPEIDLDANWDEHGDPHVHPDHERGFVGAMRAKGWDVFEGRVSHGVYLGPIIHDTYYIGGALEEIIRDRPGFWVRVSVETFPPDGGESAAAGWALLHRESE